MRQFYFIIFATLLLSPLAKAQYVPMLNENLLWQVEERVDRADIFGPEITRYLEYIKGDTVIMGETFKKLFKKRFYFYKSDNEGTVNDNSIGPEQLAALFLEDTIAQKVYYWDYMWNQSCTQNEQEKVLLYDFSLKPGDTLQNPFASISPCGGMRAFVLKIISNETGSDGITRRRFVFDDYNYNTERYYTEGIGGEGLINPFYYPGLSGVDYSETILCTKNGDSTIFGDCAQVASINDFAASGNLVSIYPNPGKGVVQISSQATIKNLRLFNAFGQLLLNQQPNEKQIGLPTTNYAPGIYYLSVNGELPQKLVVMD